MTCLQAESDRDDALRKLTQQRKQREVAEAAVAAGKIVSGRVAKIKADEEGIPPDKVGAVWYQT